LLTRGSLDHSRIDALLAAGCAGTVTVLGGFFVQFSHPADSHESGMENSDNPQSRQTIMSGDGDIGG
jgi:hypothetical protein